MITRRIPPQTGKFHSNAFIICTNKDGNKINKLQVKRGWERELSCVIGSPGPRESQQSSTGRLIFMLPCTPSGCTPTGCIESGKKISVWLFSGKCWWSRRDCFLKCHGIGLEMEKASTLSPWPCRNLCVCVCVCTCAYMWVYVHAVQTSLNVCSCVHTWGGLPLCMCVHL